VSTQINAPVPGRFGTVLTAMVTPFDDDGGLDLDGAVTLARWLTDHGTDGLVIAGTTGEAPVLSDEEKVDLWRAVVDAVTVPVVAGATSYDTAHSVQLSKRAADVGVTAILAVTPYYSRPSQAGIEGHFRAVADATDLPVILYDIPIRTGRKIEHDTILRLAREVPTIVAIKDAAANPGASAHLLAQAPDGFELYSGDDLMSLPLLAIGASGVISVASHWTGELQAEMIAAFTKGDVSGARAINARLTESWAFETGDLTPNPLPTKAMMRVMGLPAGQCRLPLGPAPDGLEDRARAVLANLGGAAVA
jgi:4-hydroxy-tetrahydrodipicolinate synthase